MNSGRYCCVLRTRVAPRSTASRCKKHPDSSHVRFGMSWLLHVQKSYTIAKYFTVPPNSVRWPPVRSCPHSGHILAFKTLNMSYLHVSCNQSCLVSKEMPEAHVDVTFVSCERRQEKKKIGIRQRSSTVVKDELTGGTTHTHTPTLTYITYTHNNNNRIYWSP